MERCPKGNVFKTERKINMTNLMQQPNEEEKVDLKTYIKDKIKMLKKEFHIRMTENEIQHLKSLQTEIAVDNYCHDLFMKRL